MPSTPLLGPPKPKLLCAGEPLAHAAAKSRLIVPAWHVFTGQDAVVAEQVAQLLAASAGVGGYSKPPLAVRQQSR